MQKKIKKDKKCENFDLKMQKKDHLSSTII